MDESANRDMEMVNRTDCLVIQIDRQENGLTAESGYADHLSIHSGGENVLENKKVYTDHLSTHSGPEKPTAQKIYNYHSSIHSGSENPMPTEIDCDHLSTYSGRKDAVDDEKYDQSSVLIKSLLERIEKVSPKPSDGPSIFKVPKHVRKVNDKAYEPQILAIGPYHADKKHLKAMEEQKVYYLKMLLQKNGDDNLTRYVSAMTELKERARACYVEVGPVDSTDESDGFVEMMILDACFIVQLLRRYETSQQVQLSHRCDIAQSIDLNDHILKGGWIMNAMRRDLLLVENQLPFFVLQKFYDMTEDQKQEKPFKELIFHFFHNIVPKRELENKWPIDDKVNHLLDLIHKSWSPFSPRIGKSESARFLAMESQDATDIARGSPKVSEKEGKNKNVADKDNWGFIRCATELNEAGITFKKKKVEKDKYLSKFKKVQNKLYQNKSIEKDNLFGIEFENGIMKMPKLKIDDNSESFFRNLVAYEQFLQNPDSSYVTDYLKFMNCLMNTSKDVELLCQSGVVENGLGDDEVLANMFNRLSENVTLFSDSFLYYDTFSKVNNYCSRSWNKWIANLRHKYFNSPWAFISFLAAVLLLALTIAQTALSVLQFHINE